jgi:hypothetical protein
MSPTTIVHNVPALVRSTLTTLIALTVTIAGLCTVLVSLPGIPDTQRAQIAAAGAGAVAFGTALRQAYAWLDKNNPSFGRVADPVLVPAPAQDDPVEIPLESGEEPALAQESDGSITATDNSVREEDGSQDVSQEHNPEPIVEEEAGA